MVQLRDDRDGPIMRLLSASLDTDGNLEIEGHDLGPGASYASDEDEWRYTIRRRDFPQLIRLLGGEPGDDILELLEDKWTGPKAQEFERILIDSGIERVNFFSWP